MKKILGILAISLIFATINVQAEEVGSSGTCISGRIVIGIQNGHTYCQSTSPGSLSWYAAMAWCQAQGRHLASIYEACDADPSQPVPNGCNNIASAIGREDKLNNVVWTSSNRDENSVYAVGIYGNLPTHQRDAILTALCW